MQQINPKYLQGTMSEYFWVDFLFSIHTVLREAEAEP